MAYHRRVLRRVLFILFALVPLVHTAVGAEGTIPPISIPPEAQYFAQRVSVKFTDFCRESVACLPPLAFSTGNNRARMLTFARNELGGPLTVTEFEGPAMRKDDGSNVIVRVNMHSVTISGDGRVTAYAGAVSNDDFEKDSTDRAMSWGEVTGLLEGVDQFLTIMADHERHMLLPKGNKA